MMAVGEGEAAGAVSAAAARRPIHCAAMAGSWTWVTQWPKRTVSRDFVIRAMTGARSDKLGLSQNGLSQNGYGPSNTN